MKKTSLALLCSMSICALVASVAAGASESGPSTAVSNIEVLARQTIVTFSQPENAQEKPAGSSWHRLVALPPGTTQFSLELVRGSAAGLQAPGGIKRIRGVPVISVVVEEPQDSQVQVAVHHDGQWDSSITKTRLYSRSFAAALDLPAPAAKSGTGSLGTGSYVIITAPEYATAATSLADWKRRKGWPVVLASTADIGTANDAIKAYLQDAYDNWEYPPEYITLIGDTDDIPTWSISQNPTDQPYTYLDGDDWLSDAMLGRICVENAYQAETVVNKSVNYERNPYEGDTAWFTRSMAVGANYPATTPVATVLWCGEQLESIGFDPADVVTYDPFDPSSPNIWNGVEPITNILEAGVSMVMYRGWAYGTAGWEPPHFIDEDIPQVENGAMTPVVFSFVCLNGNYTHDEPCFGEVFIRQGSPTESKGAVAFYGNGEHWSHTRYNDAMAISMFENVVDPSLSNLGTWIAASKIRFMDYFPEEMEASEHDEESVEFYLKIYNLLGDPELNFYKDRPTALTVGHAGTIAPGANLLEVTVHEADGTTPLAGARIGVVQSDQLLGFESTDATGLARVALSSPPATGSSVALTVTHPDRLPYEAALVTGDGTAAYVVATGTTVDDDSTAPSSGNGDGQVNPGETVEIAVNVTNQGLSAATGLSGELVISGPATVVQSSATYADLPGGQSITGNSPFVIQIDADAPDGELIKGGLTITHSGSVSDESQFALEVLAPDLVNESVTMSPSGYLEPGSTTTLILTLRNNGSTTITAGTATLVLDTPNVGSVTDATSILGAVGLGEIIDTSGDPFGLQIDPGIAEGTGISLTLQVDTDEGYQFESNLALVVGQMDIGIPVGPDNHGYFAYDSADIDYPDHRPIYQWTELSPTFGGPGTEIEFLFGGIPWDELLVIVDLPFPFQYYGQSFTQARVSDNGFISFDLDDLTHFYNWPIPSPHGNHSIIAPFWDNFHPDPEDESRPRPDGVFSYYDAVAGTYTIEWSRVSHYRPEIDDLQTFQLVLFDPAVHPTASGDGEIMFLYKQVTNLDHLRTWVTVGLESPSETDGLQLSYSNVNAMGSAPLSPGLAIKLTTEPPVYSPLTLATFQTERINEGLKLSWRPSDDRPVLGWHIQRFSAGESVRLTDEPLPASTRNFIDPSAPTAGETTYTLTALHPFGQETDMGPHAVTTANTGLLALALHPCWPNPVKDSTQFGFALPRDGQASLRIYDVAGRLVRTLVDEPRPRGESNLIWDGRDDAGHSVAGGVYFYRLQTEDEVRTRKLLLVR